MTDKGLSIEEARCYASSVKAELSCTPGLEGSVREVYKQGLKFIEIFISIKVRQEDAITK